MFETADFRQQLDDAIAGEIARNSIERYERPILNYLQNLATANEPELMAIETRKTVAERRGVPEALRSARELIRTASVFALADKRKNITLGDVQQAYREKFCEVWPFCK